MISSEVSCTASTSINYLIENGIENTLELDELAIITISDRGKIQIDASSTGKYNSEIVDFLHENDQIIFEETATSSIYANIDSNGDDNYYLINAIRYYKNYKVYLLCYNLSKPYGNRDKAIVELLMDIYYKNVMLDNESTIESNYLLNLLNNVDSIIISLNNEFKILSVNNNALGLFNLEYFSDNVCLDDFLSLFVNPKIIEAALSVVLKEGNQRKLEKVELINDSGKLFYDINILPIYNKSKQIKQLVVVGTNLTDKMIYQEEISQLNKFALIGEITSSLAHNIKNPLTNIKGCAGILEKKLAREPYFGEFVKPIASEVDRINYLINNLLSYTFMSQDQIYPYVSVDDIITNCLRALKINDNYNDILLDIYIEPDLPLIKASSLHIQQAFINIMFNGMQSIESNGILEIKCFKAEKNKVIRINIKDNGSGISEENLSNIFKPFFTTKPTGNGLGLIISKRIIENLGGNISVKSELGIQTEFIIDIPYINEEV